MKTLVWTLLTFAAVYLSLVAYLFVNQNKMVFLSNYAGRTLNGTPLNMGLEYQDVNLVTDSKVKIHGWFVPHKAPRANLIYFHGNAGNISGRLNSLRRWHELGVSVLIVDYPGYGQSSGEPSESGSYEAARAAWRHLVHDRNIRQDDIILFGRSLGGGVAIQLATEVRPKALIVESTFTSVPDIAASQFWFLPIRQLSKIKFNSLQKVKHIQSPILIVHSPDDEIIPFQHGRTLFEHANQPKDFLETKGGHNDGHVQAEPHYSQRLDRYLSGD